MGVAKRCNRNELGTPSRGKIWALLMARGYGGHDPGDVVPFAFPPMPTQWHGLARKVSGALSPAVGQSWPSA